MKIKYLFLIFVSIFLIFNEFDLMAYANELYNTDSIIERDLIARYNHVPSSEWNKYFKKQAKKIKKYWKNNKTLFTSEYETSYARILVKADKDGKILSYEIKSSCIPYNNSEFLEQVKSTMNNINNFNPLPDNYGYDYVVFTIKLHSALPQKINTNNIIWDKYGIADIEIDKKSVEIILRR